MKTIEEQKPAIEDALSSLSLLQKGEPSITAQRVALRRAAHQVLDSPLVFQDLLALSIVGRENASLIAPEEPDNVESRFIRAFMAARSRYAEDQLARAVERGTAQYVVLGAGLDTFAYRNPYTGPGLRVYEVDHPATQAWKRGRLAEEHIAIPPSVAYVPVDFETQSLTDALVPTGFAPDKPAYFSCLGVTPYLSAHAFDTLLHSIHSMCSGSGMVFDYAVARSALTPMERCAFDFLANRVAEAGETFRLFFEPDEIAAHLRKEGFRDLEDLGSPEINSRYFANRSDGLQVTGNFAHLLYASF